MMWTEREIAWLNRKNPAEWEWKKMMTTDELPKVIELVNESVAQAIAPYKKALTEIASMLAHVPRFQGREWAIFEICKQEHLGIVIEEGIDEP